jgi:hypothetical protein
MYQRDLDPAPVFAARERPRYAGKFGQHVRRRWPVLDEPVDPPPARRQRPVYSAERDRRSLRGQRRCPTTSNREWGPRRRGPRVAPRFPCRLRRGRRGSPRRLGVGLAGRSTSSQALTLGPCRCGAGAGPGHRRRCEAPSFRGRLCRLGNRGSALPPRVRLGASARTGLLAVGPCGFAVTRSALSFPARSVASVRPLMWDITCVFCLGAVPTSATYGAGVRSWRLAPRG